MSDKIILVDFKKLLTRVLLTKAVQRYRETPDEEIGSKDFAVMLAVDLDEFVSSLVVTTEMMNEKDDEVVFIKKLENDMTKTVQKIIDDKKFDKLIQTL